MAQNAINILIQAKDQASGVIKGVSSELDNGVSSSGRFSSALGSLGGVLGKATLLLTGAAAAAASAGTALGIGFNSSVEQAEAKLGAFMKDNERVARTLAWVKQEAALTQFSFVDMANAAANLTPMAKASGIALEDLVKQAEILAALNPAEGLNGAAFSLREALSGDWVSIVDRFNLPRNRINELKEQGVPAMQIISRTLNEMGIDYSLVSKQGETAAARFDQIKDKLTMLAGAATKPLFDKISQGLESVNQIDFTKVGENLAGGVQTGLEAVQNVQRFVTDVARNIGEVLMKAWEFLRPSLEELRKAFVDNLVPAIQEFWKVIGPTALDALKVLGVVIGGTVVGALWLLIKVLTISATTTGAVFKAIAASATWVGARISDFAKGFVAAFEAVRTFFQNIPSFFANLWNGIVSGVANAMKAIGNWFTSLPQAIAFALGYAAGWLFAFVTKDVPAFINGVIAWFTQLPGRIAEWMVATYNSIVSWFQKTSADTQAAVAQMIPAVLNWFAQLPGRVATIAAGLWEGAKNGFLSFGTSLLNWGKSVVDGIVDFFVKLPSRIQNAVGGAVEGVQKNLQSFGNDIIRNVTSGFNAGSKRSIGTNYAQGGSTLVGEHGPEVVNLPAGSRVSPAWKSRADTASDGAGGTTIQINGNVILQTAQAVDAFFKQQDQAQRFARMGMAA